MQEINLLKKKKANVIDLLFEATTYGNRGPGVTDTLGPTGENAYGFNGTGNSYLEFPSGKTPLFSFVNNPFEFEMVLRLDSGAMMQLLGNLVNGSGAFDYIFIANNTYQVESKFSLDTIVASTVVRNRFVPGNVKLPIGQWFNLKLRRRVNMTTMDLLIDDVIVDTINSVGIFTINKPILFRIGATSDGAFPVAGTIAKMTVTPLT